MNENARQRSLIVSYAAAIFLSAFLLFQVQPLISKFILPWFGGSPAVWTTCLLFFQTVLFAGYSYACFIDQRFTARQQALAHVALIVAAIALGSILPSDDWQPDAKSNPLDRILVILTVSVGLPYFVLSATGPLLQAWFARSFPDRPPYRLFALSNLGSLLALASYPLVFERQFNLPRQANIWYAAFIVYGVLCSYAAWRTARGRVSPRREMGSTPPFNLASENEPRPHLRQRLLWLLWPACGAVVLMATTNHISTDIAVTPLLWIVPLALYLVTFIIAFDRPHWYGPALIAVLTLVAIYAAAFVHRNGVGPIKLADFGTIGRILPSAREGEAPAEPPPLNLRIAPLQFLAANFAAMFFICLTCHGELARHRPPARYLTSYYLMIAAGGALGGIFVTLIAPRLFATYAEWQLSQLAASIFAIGLLLRALVNAAMRDDESTSLAWRPILIAPIVFLLAAVMLLDLAEFLPQSNRGIQMRTRNFFGTLAVRRRSPENPLSHCFVLQHGAIAHGAQFTHESRRREPIMYFGRTSGVGLAIEHYRARRGGLAHFAQSAEQNVPVPLSVGEQKFSGMRLGVVGLGVGTLAAYADHGDEVTFYEINPAVIDIAKNTRWFTYLSDARARGAQCHIIVGDGRLSLRQKLPFSSPPLGGEGSGEGGKHRFHLLALDAFSGDSVPVHLLTVEAFAIYLGRIVADSGAIAVNISNRYVDLEPVLHAIADHYNLKWLRIHNRSDAARGIYSADWIILTRNESLIADLLPHSRPAKPKPAVLWTDDYSNLIDVLK
jgi:hypothetical protein